MGALMGAKIMELGWRWKVKTVVWVGCWRVEWLEVWGLDGWRLDVGCLMFEVAGWKPDARQLKTGRPDNGKVCPLLAGN